MAASTDSDILSTFFSGHPYLNQGRGIVTVARYGPIDRRRDAGTERRAEIMSPLTSRLFLSFFIAMAVIIAGGAVGASEAADERVVVAGNPCNPCAARNPCSMKNPCAARARVRTPSGNTPIRKYRMTEYEEVRAMGEKLWVDTTLGKSGTSCNTCHPGGAALKDTPWPKYIAMADDVLTLDQMINFCMKNPMQASPLAWNSQKMTALASYVTGHAGAAAAANPCNPCATKNPCSTKNPCNPCATKNPCSTKNPCGSD